MGSPEDRADVANSAQQGDRAAEDEPPCRTSVATWSSRIRVRTIDRTARYVEPIPGLPDVCLRSRATGFLASLPAHDQGTYDLALALDLSPSFIWAGSQISGFTRRHDQELNVKRPCICSHYRSYCLTYGEKD